MSMVNTIKAPIQEEMKNFQPYFKTYLKSKAPLLNIIINYLLKQKGKQMRPMLVFLTAQLNGKTNESTYHAASLIELMHTATLVHDDVVDDSNMRRGFFSINAMWKNKIAVFYITFPERNHLAQLFFCIHSLAVGNIETYIIKEGITHLQYFFASAL